jgi:glucose-1-phosphate adenylyltransferase
MMPERARILAFVLAGGQGKRLQPLTAERSKPAVPFGARYRIIDFVLSNLINSKIFSVYVLVQYKSQSLIEHIRKAWTLSPIQPEQFITVVPPQMLEGEEWFLGTADAVYQNINLIEEQRPDIVAIFGADHLYRMDLRQMVRFHLESKAEVSVAALPVQREQCSAFGVIATDEHSRILEFLEKPQRPPSMPGDREHAYASMGNYLFNAEVLIEALHESHRLRETDFGHHILPRLCKTRRCMAYNFANNRVPGIKAYEESAYWRDVGTIDAYYEANMDMLELQPRFDAFNPQWPIYSSNYQGPVAKIISGDVSNTMLGAATVINGATVRNSIIRREVVIDDGAHVEDCIIMDYVRIRSGARLHRAIVDRHNLIEVDSRIGIDLDEDRARFHVTPSGLVVLPQGRVSYFPRGSRKGGIGYEE